MEPSVMTTLSNLSLFLQVLAFLMLLYSIKMKAQSMDQHARGASLAVYTIVPTIMFMFYSISLGFQLPAYGIVLILHRLLGSVLLIFIILFVTNRWRFKKKVHMDIAVSLWILTLVFGIAVYLISFGYIG
ncbi:MAG: hypothetical protein ACQESU_09495 [Halobacteriota archaeon]